MRAVESVLSQRRPADELIIVNDGQREVPAALAERAEQADVSFKVIRSRVASCPRSRNLGAAGSAGDILVFIEDDLLLGEEYLERLLELYEADSANLVAGIGAVVVEAESGGAKESLWNFFGRLAGQECWRPRRCAARYVPLPPALQGRLVPASRLYGGGLSLRRETAAAEKFDETLSGYALGEDLAFSYRVSMRYALFVAPQIKVVHARARTGRPEMYARGRMYVSNLLYIARNCVEGGAGTWLLVGFELAGAVFRYSLWGLLAFNRRALDFAAGVVRELAASARKSMRKLLCG